jgi:hypothetical protein
MAQSEVLPLGGYVTPIVEVLTMLGFAKSQAGIEGGSGEPRAEAGSKNWSMNHNLEFLRDSNKESGTWRFTT